MSGHPTPGYLENSLSASDPCASMDEVAPLQDLTDDERAGLNASLRQAEEELAAGQSVPAEELLREVRAAR